LNGKKKTFVRIRFRQLFPVNVENHFPQSDVFSVENRLSIAHMSICWLHPWYPITNTFQVRDGCEQKSLCKKSTG